MTVNSYTAIILYVLYAFDTFHILSSGDSLRDQWNVCIYVSNAICHRGDDFNTKFAVITF